MACKRNCERDAHPKHKWSHLTTILTDDLYLFIDDGEELIH